MYFVWRVQDQETGSQSFRKLSRFGQDRDVPLSLLYFFFFVVFLLNFEWSRALNIGIGFFFFFTDRNWLLIWFLMSICTFDWIDNWDLILWPSNMNQTVQVEINENICLLGFYISKHSLVARNYSWPYWTLDHRQWNTVWPFFVRVWGEPTWLTLHVLSQKTNANQYTIVALAHFNL